MKKFLSIFVMLIAMLTALGHSFTPHHEHGYKIHLSLTCASDCSGHPSEQRSTDGCISQMDEAILFSKENKCACGEHHELYPISVYTLFSLLQIDSNIILNLDKGRVYNTDYSNLYTSTYIPQSRGLRAPPRI